MSRPTESKPGLREPKPTVDIKTPVPFVREAACGEIALPVWETHGGPVSEPIRDAKRSR